MSLVGWFVSAALADPSVDAWPGEHARQAANPPVLAHRRERAPLPAATPGPDVRVYGYQAYWADDLNTVPWDQLSDIALFAAASDADGNLTSTSRWSDAETAVAIAQPYGVRVHLCVTNFSSSSIAAFLANPTARARLIASLADWEQQTGADGVNIDFEGLPSGSKQQMVDFVTELDAAVGDVVLATPAVDWSGAWDYSELTQHADLFIMGYGYHWSGSDSAGPVDPLLGGSPWGEKSLAWTIDDYLANGAAPDRVILGLPLYGYAWGASSDAVPADATSDGSAVLWDEANAIAGTSGRRFDAASRTPWYWSGGRQGWYGDTDSLRERIAYAVDANIGGVGFWALNYDGGDAALWRMVDEETRPAALPDVPDPSGFTSNAGRPFLAYPGDRVILSGADSTGPDGAVLQYLWTQSAGPAVSLSGADAMDPSFIVDQPGVHVFDLRVGDGAVFSLPAHSYVIVIDESAGQSHTDGGCDTTGSAAGLGMVGLLLVRRRRAN